MCHIFGCSVIHFFNFLFWNNFRFIKELQRWAGNSCLPFTYCLLMLISDITMALWSKLSYEHWYKVKEMIHFVSMSLVFLLTHFFCSRVLCCIWSPVSLVFYNLWKFQNLSLSLIPRLIITQHLPANSTHLCKGPN